MPTGKWLTALVYSEDTVVFSKTFEDRIEYICYVLTRFSDASVALMLKNEGSLPIQSSIRNM